MHINLNIRHTVLKNPASSLRNAIGLNLVVQMLTTWRPSQRHLRPEVLYCVKLRNETQIFCPAFALVVFEIPQCPSVKRESS